MAKTDNPIGRLRPAPGLVDVQPYSTPAFSRPVDLKLDGNEGLQPDPRVLEALALLGPDVLRRYPNARPLEELLAKRWNLTGEQVIVTAGADEALDRICRAILAPGRQIILPTPTFEMLPRYARLAGAEIVTVPWPDGPYPTEAVIEQIGERTTAIAVVSPNNPTGTSASSEDLRKIAAAAPDALIVVDLAYADFADEDLTGVALALPNAVAVRTLSKSWGLAGLRVGFAAGPVTVIDWLRAAGGPYSVSTPSLALAAEWLRLGGDAVADYIRRIRVERAELTQLGRSLGASAPESQANFVFARFPNAERVWRLLAEQGIAVRRFPNVAGLADGLRITCPGNERDFARLTQALIATREREAAIQ